MALLEFLNEKCSRKDRICLFSTEGQFASKMAKNTIFRWVDQVVWTSGSILSHLEVLDILYHWNLTWPYKADIAVHTTK